MKPLVSIILPIYNVETYLEKCINSIITQTHKNIEIILVDDGSTDGSLSIANIFAQKDERIKVKHQDNQGVSVARNYGLQDATGEWISFIDPDDWIEPTYIEELCCTAQSENADICICDFIYSYPHGEKNAYHFKENMVFDNRQSINQLQIQIFAKKMSSFIGNLGDQIGAPWGKLYRSSILKNNNIWYDPKLLRSQDCVFNLYAFEVSNKIVYTQKNLYHYRINESSATQKFSPKICDSVRAYLEAMRDFINVCEKDQIYIDALNVKITTSVYKCMYLYFFNVDFSNSYQERKKALISFIKEQPFLEGIKYVKYINLLTSEKIYVFCLKNRLVFTLNVMMNIREKTKNLITNKTQ